MADRVSPAEQSRTYGPASVSAKPYRARGVEFKQVDVTDLGQVCVARFPLAPSFPQQSQ